VKEVGTMMTTNRSAREAGEQWADIWTAWLAAVQAGDEGAKELVRRRADAFDRLTGSTRLRCMEPDAG
jgi:hypothetical protein